MVNCLPYCFGILFYFDDFTTQAALSCILAKKKKKAIKFRLMSSHMPYTDRL